MFVLLESKKTYVYTGGKPWSAEKLHSSKPTLVFVHGAQHDHSVWALQSRYFANHGYPVIAVDLPGHGRSDGPALLSVETIANWLGDLLIKLNINKAVMIGHSMGSLIALELAASERLSVAGLALLGTAVPMPVSDALLKLTQTSEARALDQINAWSHSSIAQRPGSPGPGFSTYIQNLRLMQRQTPGLLHIDFSACNSYSNGGKSASSLTCPTIIIQGQLDLMTPVKSARESMKLFGSTPGLVLIDQAGHALMAERPDAVLVALRNWITDLSA